MKEKPITDYFHDNEGLWCITLLSLATLLSFFPVLVLADGGSWTFFSLLMLWLVTYFFGFKTGLVGSFIFTILKVIATFVSEVAFSGSATIPATAEMTRDSFIKGPTVFILEYLIACTGFCLGGLLKSNRKSYKYILACKGMRQRNAHKDTDDNSLYDGYEKYPLPVMLYGNTEKENSSFGLIFGYLIGVFVMFVCYVIAAPYYDSYPAGVTSHLQRILYDIKYDGSYLLAEAAITVLILSVPAVRDVIFKLKHIANNPKEDKTFNSY